MIEICSINVILTNMLNKPYQHFGLILLIIGTLLLAFLGFISIWGDIEAFVFNAAIRSEKPLSTLRCPAIITQKDKAVVSARISNPSDRELEMLIRTNISDGYVIFLRQVSKTFYLKPGESEIISVPINIEDAAYDRVVLVRMHQIRRGSLPYLSASCGVIVFNIPWITGRHLVIAFMGLGILLSAIGLVLLSLNQKLISKNQIISFRLVIGFTLLSPLLAIIGLQGWWLLGVFLAIIWLLLGIGLISQTIMTSRKSIE